MSDTEHEEQGQTQTQAQREAMIPESRLRQETRLKRQALERVQQLEAELEAAAKKAATADTLARQIEDQGKAHAAALAEWETERAVWRVGLTDPDGIEVARLLHGKLPEKDRPSIGDWLGSLRDDPSKAPRALAAYLAPAEPPPAHDPPPAASKPAGQQAQQQAARGKPAPSSGPPATQQAYSAEQIRALREEAQRTGDYTRLRESIEGIRASVRAKG